MSRFADQQQEHASGRCVNALYRCQQIDIEQDPVKAWVVCLARNLRHTRFNSQEKLIEAKKKGAITTQRDNEGKLHKKMYS